MPAETKIGNNQRLFRPSLGFLFFIMVLITGLSACGGGSGSSKSEAPEPVDDESVELTQGGSPSSPTMISFDGLNEIKSDEFFNHFKVVAGEGDELIITATLAQNIDTKKNTACSASPGVYTGIRIDDRVRSCSKHFRHVFSEAGEYRIKFGYPDGNYGHFLAALIRNGEEPALLTDAGQGGTPDALGRILIDGENQISNSSFFNHYGYRGQKGETIYLQAYVHPTEANEVISSCSANGMHDSFTSFGWTILNAEHVFIGNENHGPRYSCSEYLEYTFTEDGLYRFNFRSTLDGTGFFRATVTPNPL